mgnify:CR=1 FL=1
MQTLILESDLYNKIDELFYQTTKHYSRKGFGWNMAKEQAIREVSLKFGTQKCKEYLEL